MKKGDQVKTNSKTSIRELGEVIEVITPKAKYDVTVARVQTERGVIRANVDCLEKVD